MQELQQRADNLQKLLSEALEKMADADRKVKDKDAELRREAFDSETKRLTAVANTVPELGEDRIKQLVDQMIRQALGQGDPEGNGGEAVEAAAPAAEPQQGTQGPGETPPMHGAQKAADGRWYVPDPKRPKKWMAVEMQGQ